MLTNGLIAADDKVFVSQEVEFDSVSPGVKLAATLLKPVNVTKPPLYVLVTGSGPQDRDEQLLGKKPFKALAEYLGRRGIATLRYDDRGVASSTGDFSAASTFDFSKDALGAVKYARTLNGFSSVGMIGHSEGGIVTSIVANECQCIDHAILLGSPAIRYGELVLDQITSIMQAQGAAPAQIETALTIQKQLVAKAVEHDDPLVAQKEAAKILEGVGIPASAAMAKAGELTSNWMHTFLRIDPAEYLKNINIPFLMLYGELDMQVSDELNFDVAQKVTDAVNNDQVAVRVLPKMNHLFQTAVTGQISEYATLPEDMSEDAMAVMAEWIIKQKQ
ncbi:alpha/beta hydrolase [Kordiimonas laminariae]|uniref:alpha/beta hydrolase n=1 Tax=Kordiimonas laminariae TaxID=2917717 RepID=UPI001FF20DEE|nr:alpha/beta hydrolase [Kordiimonas laminariae]MCK0068818.1 lysophospholipase [Kordiimonas laminariae]